ncbi:hypothetical protein KUTeg_012388 [Tegillarca granosa]|uniref:Uncharacterized protein n=1 Tax=Tegillarca granosa TaxID=220873 RepID=A0ABQ9EZE0_TEGGR|nr:hypothetical protein KUTeg_012388 [Tegillarca granosa]
MVLGIQRSKSEVDIQSVMSDVSLPSGTMIREKSSVFMVHMPDSRAAMSLLEKERHQRKHRPTPQKMLIRRKDIVDQIKAGNKQLMEQEKTKDVDVGMEKQMGEYTFADLQMNIDTITSKNTRRGFKGKIDPKKQQQEINNINKEKVTGLPQLNTIKPFGS